MTTSQLIASAITWIAAIAAVIAAALAWRAQQQARDFLIAVRAERRTFTIPGGGVLTFDRRMSDADVGAFKAAWLRAYKPGAAHPVEPLIKDGAVCAAYQEPTMAEDSGLCARCGMYDYKHQEQRL